MSLKNTSFLFFFALVILSAINKATAQQSLDLTLKLYPEGLYQQGGLITSPLNNSGEDTIASHADSVYIELVLAAFPFSSLHTTRTLLKTDGNAIVMLPDSLFGQSCYIIARHRSSLEIWSSTPVVVSENTYYNFSSLPMFPGVTTESVNSITSMTAFSGGNVIASGGAAVLSRGVCWSRNPLPTIFLTTRTSDGSGMGVFSSFISGLSPNTTYYVRAYVTSEVGTAYGNQYTFRTRGLLGGTTGYCTAGQSTGSCPSGEWISAVVFGEIHNTGQSCALDTPASGYQNFLSQSTFLTRGHYVNPLSVTVSAFRPGNQLKAWFDWNHNNVFTDPGEEYDFGTLSGSGTVTFSTNINVPDNALLGPTRMRVRLSWLSSGPCGISTAGETEDYSVNVRPFNEDASGNVYDTVLIGNQVWMKQNLKTVRYRNGDTIPSGLTNSQWLNTTNGACAISGNSPVNDSLFGKLYNWFAVADQRGLCPNGWHVAAESDWQLLEANSGMPASDLGLLGGRGEVQNVGGKLKSISALWSAPNTGANDSSGFSGLPGGTRELNGSYNALGSDAYWWTSTATTSSHAWYRNLNSGIGDVFRFDNNKHLGYSIRCVKNKLPVLSTIAVSSVSNVSAAGGGLISSDGFDTISARGVVWSTQPNPSVSLPTKTNNGDGTGSFLSAISGLSPFTTYYVRAYAINGTGVAYGNEISFTTLSLPNVSTSTMSSILVNSAVSGGTVNGDGGTPVTLRGVCWSMSPLPTVSLNTRTIDGSGLGAFSSSLYNLSMGTTYFVRAYATNSVGTSYGNQISFTTLNVPTVSTTAMSSVLGATAVSGGHVSNDGGSPVTIRGVCWSTSPSPTVALPTKTADGADTGSYVSNLSGLFPGTVYYIRAYATNAQGTAYGSQLTFTTATLPVLSTTAAGPVLSTLATAGGTISSDGGAPVTARGVCWSTSPEPTVALSTKTVDGAGAGGFSSSISGLSQATTYYLRAYATNGVGTAYGDETFFTTTQLLTDGDGNNYETVLIGSDVWTAGNLRTGKYRNGNVIPGNISNSLWNTLTSGASALYNGATANDAIYGKLYNWYAVADPRGLCPSGWHVPSDAEWQALETVLGMPATELNNTGSRGSAQNVGGKMKAKSNLWYSPNTGATNSSGFSGLPGGYRIGIYSSLSSKGAWWTSTSTSTVNAEARARFLDAYNGFISRNSFPKGDGYSVRCLRDVSIQTTAVTAVAVTATSGGVINNAGPDPITGRGVCWSTAPGPTVTLTTKTSDGSGTGSFTSTMNGLSPGTTYFVRAYATNAIGTSYGNEISFTTLKVPSVGTTAVSNVLNNTAMSGGTVSNDGGTAVTARGVCWSTSPGPTVALSTKTTDGSGTGSFSSNITGLNPGTKYYVRAYATNGVGTAYGNERTFTTYLLVDVDGNAYDTVLIGTQVWMSENLRVSKYRNGDPIPGNLTNTTWHLYATSGAYAFYSNAAVNDSIYGKLYNGYAVADPRGLCPTGWHVPSDVEWTTLENFLGGTSVAGGKMKAVTSLWQAPNTGATNSSGFTALPGGSRDELGYFSGVGIDGVWWSSTQNSYANASLAWCRRLDYGHASVGKTNRYMENGFSVRCVRD